MKTKKIDTLFHGTKKISSLISIIKNGFYSSYTNEKLGTSDVKIVMVSFSNIPLIEARNQVNYGNYFIGLKRSWGIEKGLHPVAYTYEESKFENDVISMLEESTIGNVISILKSAFDNNHKVFDTFSDTNYITKNLSNKNLDEETLKILTSYFEDQSRKLGDLRLYLKRYMVLDNKNQQRFAYNDREWRYIPREIEKKILHKSQEQYKEFDLQKKPHFKSNPLLIKLEDISYIIVKSQTEIDKIFSTLEKKYDSKSVFENIKSGNLTILSMDKILNDL